MLNEIASEALPQLTNAANQDFRPARSGAPSSGWNAYDVWRVHIKAVLDLRSVSIALARNVDRAPVTECCPE